MPSVVRIAAGIGLLLALPCPEIRASPQSPPDPGERNGVWERTQLSGSWAGLRPALAERGLELEVLYTLDGLANVAGGRSRGTEILGKVDLRLFAELAPLVGWDGARLHVSGLGTHGGDPSDRVGDVQIVDNIEAFDTWKLYEAWLEQNVADDALSLRAGLYDLSAEFDVIPAAALLLHSSFGTGAEFGTSGRNGPSAFPVTSLAGRVEVRPTEGLSVRAIVADGVPGDPDDPRGTHVRFADGDGVLLAGELAYSAVLHGGCLQKFAVGAWGYTTEFEQPTNGGAASRSERGAAGVYALGERCLFREASDPHQGLSLFGRAGIADETGAVADAYLGAGLVYRGPLPGRAEDQLAFGIAAAHLAEPFRDALATGTQRSRPWEVALELTFLANLTPWLALQPDLQLVIHPGREPGLADAWVLGSRMHVAF